MDTHVTNAVLRYLLDPFKSVDTILTNILRPLTAITDLTSKSAWLYLLSGLGLAWLIFRGEKRHGRISTKATFWNYVFPKDIYWHPSARLDYQFVLLDLAMRGFVYVPLMSGFAAVLYKLCLWLATIPPGAQPTAPVTIMTCVLAFVVMDFGFFLTHYVMHRIPVLWHFHEVHHSAAVLTPVTVYRAHPVEAAVQATISSLASGLVAVVYRTLSDDDLNFMTILGVNAFTFVFLFTGNVLRHSHLWLSYWPWLSRILISPAQHQIHHSQDQKHWDKNFGYVFALWDGLFGTLYIPQHRETLKFGLPEGSSQRFSSIAQLYCGPFSRAFGLMRPGLSLTPPLSPSSLGRAAVKQGYGRDKSQFTREPTV